MQRLRIHKPAFFTLALVLFGTLAFGAWTNFRIEWIEPGGRDWIAYWGVPHLLLRGKGFFDITALADLQSSVGYPQFDHFPVMRLWNPPPLIALLLPFGGLDMTSAALLWIALSSWSYMLAALLFNQTLARPLPKMVAVGLALLFVPFFMVIATGQLSSFIAACLVFTWYLQRKERHAAAGILIVPLLLKPHLVSLAAVLLVWQAWRRRAWPFFLSAAACLLLLVLVSFLVDPRWLTGWRAQGPPLLWLTQAPFDVFQFFTKAPNWLQFIGIALVGPWFLWHHRAVPTIDPQLLAKTLLVSILIAPYGYNFDTTMLLPTALFIGSQLWQRNQKALLALCTLLNVWLVPFHMEIFRYFAYLLLVVWLWILSTRPEPAPATRVAAGD